MTYVIMWINGNRKKTTNDYGDEIMKILIVLGILWSILSFFKYIILDILDDLVIKKKSKQQSRTAYVSKSTYKYKKAQ